MTARTEKSKTRGVNVPGAEDQLRRVVDRILDEAEIRAVVQARWDGYGGGDDLVNAALDHIFDAVAWTSGDGAATSDLWADLRPTEANRVQAIIDDARFDLMAAIKPQIIEAAVRAALQFAAEYPNAPRAKALQPA